MTTPACQFHEKPAEAILNRHVYKLRHAVLSSRTDAEDVCFSKSHYLHDELGSSSSICLDTEVEQASCLKSETESLTLHVSSK